VREERFVEHTLQTAIQAAIDVTGHIVSDERLGEPRTNREMFDLLARRVALGGLDSLALLALVGAAAATGERVFLLLVPAWVQIALARMFWSSVRAAVDLRARGQCASALRARLHRLLPPIDQAWAGSSWRTRS
jgi:hypothetical protein